MITGGLDSLLISVGNAAETVVTTGDGRGGAERIQNWNCRKRQLTEHQREEL